VLLKTLNVNTAPIGAPGDIQLRVTLLQYGQSAVLVGAGGAEQNGVGVALRDAVGDLVGVAADLLAVEVFVEDEADATGALVRDGLLLLPAVAVFVAGGAVGDEDGAFDEDTEADGAIEADDDGRADGDGGDGIYVAVGDSQAGGA